ncbi:WD40/YVTN/BNR-like repeat-containing protein [Kutzneria chonburiensis]|uniref:WD40/YVTN/BNR-like repeat-containing protein n=1 Tax=Kutzneria chonburiensis TaxID=1483604 RepID=UPI00235EE5D6|nr:hypothetical protein [Kutzneria chonburiensis]
MSWFGQAPAGDKPRPLANPGLMHRFLRRAVLAMGLTVALAVPANAAPGPQSSSAQWLSMGPNASGGYLAFTPAAPSRLYVLPDGARAVFRSDDHGITWAPPTPFADGVSGSHLAADPRDANVVYVAASVLGGGKGYVYRSTDGARSFHQVFDDSADIYDVAVLGRKVYAAGASGVFESQDRGTHWTLVKGSPAGAKRLVVDGDALFVATDSAVYKGTVKLPVPGDIFVEHLAAHGPLVVASQERDGSAVISIDGGRSWRAMTGPWGTDWVSYLGITPGGDIQAQTLEPSPGPNARKNTWVSHDNGRHWTPQPKALPALDLYSDLGSFPDRPNELVISAAAGIYTTTDSARFRRIGVPAVSVGALAISGSSLIAGTSVDSYRSTSSMTAKPRRATRIGVGPARPRRPSATSSAGWPRCRARTLPGYASASAPTRASGWNARTTTDPPGGSRPTWCRVRRGRWPSIPVIPTSSTSPPTSPAPASTPAPTAVRPYRRTRITAPREHGR